MASPFKHIAQIKSLADCSKFTKQALDKVAEDWVKVQYFAKFPFDKKEAPLLLVGDVPTPVLMEVKKAGGAAVLGRCSTNGANQLVFEGVKSAMARKALAALGIQRIVATNPEEDEKDEVESETKTEPAPKKTIPQAPPQPIKGATKLPVVEDKSKDKPPISPKLPEAKKAISPMVKKQSKPRIPKPGVTKEMLAAKDEFSKRVKVLFPLYQKALDTVGAPEAELKQCFKAAGEAAVATKYDAAEAALDELQTLVTETLDPAKSSGGDEGKEDELEELGAGQFAKSLNAWQKAMKEANTSISALQAALLKTQDPRAAGLASGFKRILQKLPNPGVALEAMAAAAEKNDAEAVEKHKASALNLANSCTSYLGSDKLVSLAISNPFVAIKLSEQFESALQTLHAELK